MLFLTEPPTIYDVEALLYVQGAQLHKFRQELSVFNASANLAQHAHVVVRGYPGMLGCGRGGELCGCGRGGPIGNTTGTMPT